MARRPRLAESALALGAGGLGALLALTGLAEPADNAFYDPALLLVPGPEGRSPVVVVAIDEPSFAEVGRPWPWPRDLHAGLLRSIRAGAPASIGVDIVLADPGEPAADAALAAAMGAEVVLAADRVRMETPQGVLTEAVDPLPALLASGARAGQIGLPVESDGAIRRLPEGDDTFAALLAGRTPPPGARIRYAQGPLPRVSYYQALAAESDLPPGIFRDRVVLVGLVLRASPLTAGDSFRTPLTAGGHGLTPGVEIQAQAVRSLLAQDWIRPLPPALTALLALALGWAAVLNVLRRTPVRAVATTLGLALLPALASLALLAAGLWMPPAAPALAALAGGIGKVGIDLARETRRRREITRIFGQYLAPALVRKLARDPSLVTLGGERRVVTVLFCDLRGFTSLSERFSDDPQALTQILNRALAAIADAVLAHEGLIDKFIGDCVMALWNAPTDDPHHADHAIAAGRAAVEGIAALSVQLEAEGLPVALACGVGINTGECTVGNLGTARRFDYTAVGDAVNIASRIESLTKEMGVPILVGGATAALAVSEPLVELSEAPIRGRTGAISLFTTA